MSCQLQKNLFHSEQVTHVPTCMRERAESQLRAVIGQLSTQHSILLLLICH